MHKNIEGTPFYIVKREGIYFAAMKNSIITPKFREEDIPEGEEPELFIERYINDHIWDIIVTVVVIVHSQIAEEVTKFMEAGSPIEGKYEIDQEQFNVPTPIKSALQSKGE